MKVLYVAYRHDPRNPDAGSGSDFHFYAAIKRSGAEVYVSGPDIGRTWKGEELVRRLYQRATHMRYAKYPLSRAATTSWALERTVNRIQPDLVFSLYPPPLITHKAPVPLVFRTDTPFIGQQREWPLYGGLALNICTWQERRVFKRSSMIITHSEWSKQVLVDDYHVASERVVVFANPAALPSEVVPKSFDVIHNKQLGQPLELLLVGRDYKRKGITLALELVDLLNSQGCLARLTICGLSGRDSEHVRFVGPYMKSNLSQLKDYVDLYRKAHFLVHPAIFEAAGIVPSEAAAFGTPTITNDTGGLATTVRDGESGIVLPKGSPARKYATVIIDLVRHPDSYYALCTKTRQRYERELNWDVAGRRIGRVLHEVAQK